MDKHSPDWMVLDWLLRAQARGEGRMLFDADVAQALGWSGGEAQAVVARLQQAGCLDSRVFIRAGGTRSLGDLRLTPAGQAALGQGGRARRPWRLRRMFAA